MSYLFAVTKSLWSLVPDQIEQRLELKLWDDPDVGNKVPGRIHEPRFRQFWSVELKADSVVMETIDNGYSLPLTEWPPKSSLPNNQSARLDRNRVFVEDELEKLEAAGAIYEVKEDKPWLIIPIQVAEPPGRKKRIVIDASRQLNPYLDFGKISMDHLAKIVPEMPQGCWFATLDLKSGYYHLKVAEEHQKLLGIQWTYADGRVKTWQWRVSFLGIASLVWKFTKMLIPNKVYLHLKGIPNFCFVDDLIVLGRTEEECLSNLATAKWSLEQAGWCINEEKIMLPTRRGVFLGLELDSKTRSIDIPEKKLKTIHAKIDLTVVKGSAKARDLASVYGSLVSVLMATGPQILLLCRQGFRSLGRVKNWEISLNISNLHEELRFLRKKLGQVRWISNGKARAPNILLHDHRLRCL